MDESGPIRRLVPVPGAGLDSVPTPALFSKASKELGELTRKEIELARAELRADLSQKIALVRWFAVAAVAGLCFVDMLSVAAAFSLSSFLPGWAAAIAVAGLLLLAAAAFGYLGWKKKVLPLESTKRTLRENWKWARSRIA